MIQTDKITFSTLDGVFIKGNWQIPKGAKVCALLLHMMPSTRESFASLSEKLYESGIATLAIDLRGHGESLAKKSGDEKSGKLIELNYKDFSDEQHQASRLDVDAALNFIKVEGFNEDKAVIVGASIGANLTLDAMSRYSRIARGVLLSPGLDYRGVKTEAAAKALEQGQKVWAVASEGDVYSAQTCETLVKMKFENISAKIFSGSDHGTNLFNSQPDLIADIVGFLSK